MRTNPVGQPRRRSNNHGRTDQNTDTLTNIFNASHWKEESSRVRAQTEQNHIHAGNIYNIQKYSYHKQTNHQNEKSNGTIHIAWKRETALGANPEKDDTSTKTPAEQQRQQQHENKNTSTK